MRLVTFDFSEVDLGDERAVERSWNDFVDALRFQGLRPADTAHSWTDTTMTYRAFSIELEEEQETFSLDFDIAKLGRVATGVLAMAVAVGAGLLTLADSAIGVVA